MRYDIKYTTITGADGERAYLRPGDGYHTAGVD